MITLEQVRLLGTKVSKAIDTIQKLTEENKLLRKKLDGYQGRIHELEVLIQRFKEDQGKIEAGIISALDRLNKFEDTLEPGLEINQNIHSASPVETILPESDHRVDTAETAEQQVSVDPNSDEAILAILEQEEKARQNTFSESPEPEVTATSPGAELDIF